MIRNLEREVIESVHLGPTNLTEPSTGFSMANVSVKLKILKIPLRKKHFFSFIQTKVLKTINFDKEEV